MLIHTHTYSYILIHTHTYSYILIHNHTYAKVMLDYDERIQSHSASDKGKFICIRKESVWKATDTPDIANIFNSLAFLDFIIASKSKSFYGHRYSSFSQHLVHHELHSKNISAQYYNQRVNCV